MYKKKSFWDSENEFYQNSDISRIGKLLYHYEIYKMIKDLPGDILEFGVFKGSSLIRLLTFRNLIENNFSRKIMDLIHLRDSLIKLEKVIKS